MPVKRVVEAVAKEVAEHLKEILTKMMMLCKFMDCLNKILTKKTIVEKTDIAKFSTTIQKLASNGDR
jgi:hypothetical protein